MSQYVEAIREILELRMKGDDAGLIEEMAETGARLVDEIEVLGEETVDEVCFALDELVHDCASHDGADAANTYDDEDDQEDAIDAAFADAADINNAGIVAQVAVILAYNGLEEGERLIREAINRNADDI